MAGKKASKKKSEEGETKGTVSDAPQGGRGPTDAPMGTAEFEERRRQKAASDADSPGKRGPTDISAEAQQKEEADRKRRLEEAREVDRITRNEGTLQQKVQDDATKAARKDPMGQGDPHGSTASGNNPERRVHEQQEAVARQEEQEREQGIEAPASNAPTTAPKKGRAKTARTSKGGAKA